MSSAGSGAVPFAVQRLAELQARHPALRVFAEYAWWGQQDDRTGLSKTDIANRAMSHYDLPQ